MSVDERTEIDHKGTDKVTGLERGIGGALIHARDGRSSGGERAPRVATSSGVSKGRRRLALSEAEPKPARR